MTELSDIKDPFLRYVFDFQRKEQSIQHALENSKINVNGKIMTLEEAILDLAQTYGTQTKEARARTQVVLNTHAILNHFREVTFATTEERNAVIQKAAKMSENRPQEDTEKAWEEEVLRKARAERDAENLELPSQ